jgi:hypothetical protein
MKVILRYDATFRPPSADTACDGICLGVDDFDNFVEM